MFCAVLGGGGGGGQIGRREGEGAGSYLFRN